MPLGLFLDLLLGLPLSLPSRLPLRICDALRQAQQAGVDRLDAQLLLGHLFNRPRTWLVANDEQPLPPAAEATWPAALARRAQGEPLAYVLGEQEFCGLSLSVNSSVLVPRPETEVLVHWALECWLSSPSPEVVDLGTGSGAVALSIKRLQPAAQLTASDVSATALGVAQLNARRHRLAVAWAQGDWWAAVAGQRFGLAVSNPPYISQGDAHLAALSHEPELALTSGADGLDALRQIIDGAPEHLLAGAWLLLEHGHDQAEVVRELLTRRGFAGPVTRHDLAQLPRCTGACWPGEYSYRSASR